MAPIIFSIDGNIGSGKTSIFRYLEENFTSYCKMNNKNLKVCFLQEPIDEWETIVDFDNKNIITKFYENNEKYAFPFQMMAYITRLSLFKDAIAENFDIIFTERSMLTDKNIFVKMLFDSEKMNVIEYQIYNIWFNEFSNFLKNIKQVYIKTDPEICKKRIIKRNRKGENIDNEYLELCHYYHEVWFTCCDYKNDSKNKTDSKNKIDNNEEILLINGNIETDTNQFDNNSYYQDIVKKIFDFVFDY